MKVSLRTLLFVVILLVSIQASTICPFCLPIDHCKDQQDLNCKQCEPGYDLIGNQCKPKSSVQVSTPIPNCMNQQGAICRACFPGYDLLGNRCIRTNQSQSSSQNYGLKNCNQEQKYCEAQNFDSIESIRNFYEDRKAESESGQSSQINSAARQTFFEEPANQNTAAEADVVRTNGQFIYTYYRNRVTILRGYPEDEANSISSISVGFNIQGMFFRDESVCVFGIDAGETKISVISVANGHFNPFIAQQYSVSGVYFNSRMTPDGHIYFVTKDSLSNFRLPSFTVGGINFSLNFNQIFIFDQFINVFQSVFLTIFTFDINTLVNPGIASYITKDPQNLFASENAIYITYPINLGAETVIHKVLIQGSNILPFSGNKIEGVINNQFSFDEYQNVFRVASSNIALGRNFLYTFDFNMNLMDEISNWGPFNRIYAVRFTENRAYISTANFFDPFYVMDISNPFNLQVIGQFVNQGLSRFLYVFDENILLSFGRQSKLATQPLEITLLDVENPNNIQIIDNVIITGNLDSSAEFDYKALLISRTKNLVSLPVRNSNVPFNGVIKFYIDRNRIIEPTTDINISGINGIINQLPANYNPFIHSFEDYTAQRSFIIEEILYTKSKCKIEMNLIFDGRKIKSLDLPNCP